MKSLTIHTLIFVKILFLMTFETSAQENVTTAKPSNATEPTEISKGVENTTTTVSNNGTEVNKTTIQVPEGNATLSPHAKFKDSGNWGKEFPKCDPSNNSNLSPINIITESAIPVKDVKTVTVYSGDPIRNYSLSTSYQGEDNVTISIINIQLDPGIFYEATHVAGLGAPDIRMFRRIVFLFSKTKPSPESGLSLHQINGKIFPMEIVMFFYNPSLDKITTQLSVMVEIQGEENPMFYPIVQAAKKIKQMKSKSDMLKELKEKMEAEEKALEAIMKEPINENVKKYKGKVRRIVELEKSIKEEEDLLQLFEEMKSELEIEKNSTNHMPLMQGWADSMQKIQIARINPTQCQLKIINGFKSNGTLPGTVFAANMTRASKLKTVEETMTANCARKKKKKKKKPGEASEPANKQQGPGDSEQAGKQKRKRTTVKPADKPGDGKAQVNSTETPSGPQSQDGDNEEPVKRKRKRTTTKPVDAKAQVTVTEKQSEPQSGNATDQQQLSAKREVPKEEPSNEETNSFFPKEEDANNDEDDEKAPPIGGLFGGNTPQKNGKKETTKPSDSGDTEDNTIPDSGRRRRRVKRSFEIIKIQTLRGQLEEAEKEQRSLKNLIEMEMRKMSPLLKAINVNNMDIVDAKSHVEEKKKELRGLEIGSEFEIKNSTELTEKLRDEIILEMETETAKKRLVETRKKKLSIEQSTGWTSRLFLFQASWLLPAFGGYYYYPGSSPIPPCNERVFTVVFKRSIGISQEQFDVLASLPAYEDYEPLEDMLPPMREVGERQVSVNLKNIQYLMDDGVHLKSAERHRLKLELKSGAVYCRFDFFVLFAILIGYCTTLHIAYN